MPQSTGDELTAILNTLRAKEYTIKGDLMKRPPREYPAVHPHAELLRHRSILAARALTDEDVLRTSHALDWVVDRAPELDELLEWLARSVTAPASPPSSVVRSGRMN